MLAGIEETPEEAIAKLDCVTKEQVAQAAKDVTLDTVYFLNGTMAPAENDGTEDEDDE